MAPQKINDDKLLYEIARVMLHKPNAPFAAICRQAMARVPMDHHSEEASRRRLQRKFGKTRAY